MKFLNVSMILIFLSTSSFGQIKESKAIDSIFSEWNKPNVPGCGLGIIKDGKLIYARGYGMANLEYNIPNSETSVFRIGSTSKQFTAACIVLLVEQKKIDLEDTLHQYYPDFPEYAKHITMRNLLNHTSGIRDYLTIAYLKGLGDDDYYQDSDIMKWLVRQQDLNFPPGDEYLYSNSGYWLLGQIVNKVSGMSMANYAHKNLFQPLEMVHTHFHNDHTQLVKNRASGYRPNTNGGYEIGMTTLDMIGDGGIFTSIEDIKKWDDAFYDAKVLSKKFWSRMTQQGVLNNGERIDYAAGLIVSDYNGLKTVSHGGAFVGFRANIIRFPEQHFSVVIFTNRADANPTKMGYQVADIFLEDQFIIEEKLKKTKKSKDLQPKSVVENKKIDSSKIDLNQYSGSYFSAELDATYQINVEGEVLKVSIRNNAPLRLIFSSKDQFSYHRNEIRFNRSKHIVSGFELDAGRVKNLKFVKKEQ